MNARSSFDDGSGETRALAVRRNSFGIATEAPARSFRLLEEDAERLPVPTAELGMLDRMRIGRVARRETSTAMAEIISARVRATRELVLHRYDLEVVNGKMRMQRDFNANNEGVARELNAQSATAERNLVEDYTTSRRTALLDRERAIAELDKLERMGVSAARLEDERAQIEADCDLRLGNLKIRVEKTLEGHAAMFLACLRRFSASGE